MYHPVRQHLLLLRGLGRLSLVVFWRTDEGVCPYFEVLHSPEKLPFTLLLLYLFIFPYGLQRTGKAPLEDQKYVIKIICHDALCLKSNFFHFSEALILNCEL